MKVTEKEKVVTETIYTAKDGTEFSDKAAAYNHETDLIVNSLDHFKMLNHHAFIITTEEERRSVWNKYSSFKDPVSNPMIDGETPYVLLTDPDEYYSPSEYKLDGFEITGIMKWLTSMSKKYNKM